MVLQKIYVQYRYGLQEYFLPNANIGVDGDSFYEECTSAFDGISTGCGFNLIEGHIYDTAATKDGYYLTAESICLDFTAPVEPYILLWLFPREPSVTTLDATNVTSNSATLNGELTDLDGVEATDVCFLYGKVGESYTVSTEWTHYEPDTFSYNITGLAPDTTYNFKTRANNITEEDTFYVFSETKQFTTLPATGPPVVYTYDTAEISSTSALLCGYLGASGGITTDIGFEYGETTSYGTTVWTDTFESPGHYTEAITGLSFNTLYHVRAIAENDYGTGYGVDKEFTTLEPASGMFIMLPNANGKLFLDNQIIACDDPAEACTEFRFLVMNTGDVTASAWYTVSIVGGGDPLYSGTVPNLAPGVGSSYIEDLVCALPGGLPVGTHTIKVEAGPEGMAATDSYTEDVYVIDETVPTDGMHIVLPNATLLEDATVIACDDPAEGCTYFNFQIKNYYTFSWWPYYEVSIVGGATLYSGTLDALVAGASTSIIRDIIPTVPNGLPLGEHTIEVKAYPLWSEATDTHTELLTVVEEAVLPQVTTVGAIQLNDTTVELQGELTSMAGAGACDVYFRYGDPSCIWSSKEFGVFDTLTSPSSFQLDIGGLTQGVTLYYRAATACDGGSEVVGELNQITLTETTSAMQIILPNITLLDKAEIVYTKRADIGSTDYNLQIQNSGGTSIAPWFKLYVDTTLVDYGTLDILIPGAVSATINNSLNAIAESIEVGAHTVKVEVGPDGMAATATHTEQLTVLEPYTPSGVDLYNETYLNVCGAEIANNCITADIHVEHFGSDSECSLYLEYWSEGDTGHNFTTPIVVPYDPVYDGEEGLEVQGVTACIPDCEKAAHIRAVASNDIGTSYSGIVTPITVRLDAPTEITQTSVALNAYIISMGSVTNGSAYFKYGTPSPDTYSDPHIPISSPGAISHTITGLIPNTTYQYSIYARCQSGYPKTLSGTMTFTTLPMPGPAVNTGSASSITQTGATLSGLLSDSNDVSTHIGFEYGKTESYGTTIWDSYTSVFTSYNTDVSGLNPGTLYHVRAIATNEYGTGYGADSTFTTLAELYDITFIATAPGISDLHDVDVNDFTDPENPLYLGRT